MATTPDYSLSWILPFVRESLRERGNFSFDGFVDGLWPVLGNAGVSGIEKHPPTRGYSGTTYDWSQAANQLRVVTCESFYYLIQNGFVIPGAPTNQPGFPDKGRFYLTTRGIAWAASVEPPPEDVEGYLKLLKKLVPNLDAVIEQYVTEGLRAFERRTYFAAAVMIGAASEKAVYLLAESMRLTFKDHKQSVKLEGLINSRGMKALFDFIQDTIINGQKSKAIPYSIAEGASPHLMSLVEAIRVQRNDAVHPQNAKVSDLSVRLSYQAFPHALEKFEELREWFIKNPNTI